MSQHDYNIANQGYSAFRTDLNLALIASQTMNSGTAAPVAPQAGQLWLDTDTPSATVWTVNFYDGTDQIGLFQIDSSNNRLSKVGANLTMDATALFLGDTSDADITTGLCINQGAADNYILTLKSSDVAHGVTSIAETDTYGWFGKADATAGVLKIGGMAEAGNGNAMELHGYANSSSTSATTGARSPCEFHAFSFSGASVANLAANAMAGGFRAQRGGAEVTVFIVDVEGDTFQDGTAGTAYDAYDDAALNRDFNKWLGTNREAPDFARMERLAQLKVLGRVTREEWNAGVRPLWSPGKMVQIHTGALEQAHEREQIRDQVLAELLGDAYTARIAALAVGRNVGRIPAPVA